VAYGNVTISRFQRKLLIIVDLPDEGELAGSGRSENFVDPSRWLRHVDERGKLVVKLAICRPLGS